MENAPFSPILPQPPLKEKRKRATKAEMDARKKSEIEKKEKNDADQVRIVQIDESIGKAAEKDDEGKRDPSKVKIVEPSKNGSRWALEEFEGVQ